MKIVTVLHSHGMGGAERHALGLMCALRDAGHDMLFAGPSDSWLAWRDTAGLKNALLLLLVDAGARHAMGQAERRHVLDMCGTQAMVYGNLSVYRTLCRVALSR